jgi:hypothetical protein
MRKKMEGSKHVVEYDVSSTTRGIVLSKRHHGKHRAAAVASKKASDKAYDFDMLVKKGKIGPRDENSDEREDVDAKGRQSSKEMQSSRKCEMFSLY